ncbi:MAG: sterol desaturase family protein [Steroidobacteraceae bacterium]
MSAAEFMTLDINRWSVVLFFAAMAVEIFLILVLHLRGRYVTKDSALNLFLGLGSLPANAAAAFITFAFLGLAQSMQWQAIPITWGSFLLCFVLDDLRFYVHHRIAHRCRWVWAMHVVHHSSQEYNLSVAIRQAWTKHFTGTMLLKVPLVLVGFDMGMVVFCGVLNATYQFFLHTETVRKFPRWFEAIFNTPSHHRVHHASNPRYLDANYAGTLIIWDRLFGTFVEEGEQPVYGLVRNIETRNPIRVLFAEYGAVFRDLFTRGLTLQQRFKYLLAPPGWSHDGSRQGTDAILAAAGIDRKNRQPSRSSVQAPPVSR